MVNSVDPDGLAHNELLYLNLFANSAVILFDTISVTSIVLPGERQNSNKNNS